jgi:hypothetical protein
VLSRRGICSCRRQLNRLACKIKQFADLPWEPQRVPEEWKTRLVNVIGHAFSMSSEYGSGTVGMMIINLVTNLLRTKQRIG